jgi:hypothetical protein
MEKGKVKGVPVLNTTEGIWGSESIDLCFLDLGSTSSFLLHLSAALLQRKVHQYPLVRRLIRPQSRFGRYGEDNIFKCARTRSPAFLS